MRPIKSIKAIHKKRMLPIAMITTIIIMKKILAMRSAETRMTRYKRIDI